MVTGCVACSPDSGLHPQPGDDQGQNGGGDCRGESVRGAAGL